MKKLTNKPSFLVGFRGIFERLPFKQKARETAWQSESQSLGGQPDSRVLSLEQVLECPSA